MSRLIFTSCLALCFIGCGSGGSSPDSACGPVIQNVNLPQNLTENPVPVATPQLEKHAIPASELENTEQATEDNGGAIVKKDFSNDGTTVTLTGCQIVTTGDTTTNNDTATNNNNDNHQE